jgi:hypothetical protein
MSGPRTTTRRGLALLATGATLSTLGIATLAPSAAVGSSHREAPLISGAPQYDNTDLYAYVSKDRQDAVTFVTNWTPFEAPAGGPNFYPFADDAAHDLLIDNNGDARPDITYRWTFQSSYRNRNTFLYNTGVVTSLTDPDLNFRQTYDLQLLRPGHAPVTLLDNAPVAPSRVGDASMPNYGALRRAAVATAGGLKSYTGQADDPFFLDLRVFDLLYGGDLSEVGDDTLRGFNVNAIVLQVPKAHLTAGGDPTIGVWTTTSRRNARGAWVQVSRLGNPLVNEVVVPLKDKDKFNASRPVGDAQFLSYVTDPELARLLNALYGVGAPTTNRQDLVQIFLTGLPGLNQPMHVTPSEQLRLNTSIPVTERPKRLGALVGDNQGYPNGRRLTDDVVDIALQAVAGELAGNPNNLGDGVFSNDRMFTPDFPYVAIPHSGSMPRPAASTSGATLLTGGAEPKSGGGTPVLPVSAAALGALVLVGGAVTLRRGRRMAAMSAV